MAKFRVSFIQHNIHSYIVEADNGEEAKEKAYDMFLDEMCWFKPDIDCDKIEVEELNDIEPIDAVRVLHDISLHHIPTPVSEFESGFNYGLNKAMREITRAPTLTPPNEWVSVYDRLPEPGERVLATDCGFVGEFYINKRGKWQRYNVNCSELLMALDILYWMPLPASPDCRSPEGEA